MTEKNLEGFKIWEVQKGKSPKKIHEGSIKDLKPAFQQIINAIIPKDNKTKEWKRDYL